MLLRLQDTYKRAQESVWAPPYYGRDAVSLLVYKLAQ